MMNLCVKPSRWNEGYDHDLRIHCASSQDRKADSKWEVKCPFQKSELILLFVGQQRERKDEPIERHSSSLLNFLRCFLHDIVSKKVHSAQFVILPKESPCSEVFSDIVE